MGGTPPGTFTLEEPPGEQLEAYDGIIQEEIKSGIVEKVPEKALKVIYHITQSSDKKQSQPK